MTLTFLDGRPYAPQPGDWCTIRSGGWGAAGIRVFTRGDVNHAALVVDTTGRTLEVHPGGASWGTVRGYVFRHPHAAWAWGRRTRGDLAAEWAVARFGIGYNTPGLAALGAAQWPTPRHNLAHAPWVRQQLAQSLEDPPRSLFCSQAVDAAWHHAGVELFTDGRAPGNVSPMQLDTVGRQHGWYLGYLGTEDVDR